MTDSQRTHNWSQAADHVSDIERLHKSISACGPLKDYELNGEEKWLVQALCLLVLGEIKARAGEENDGK